MELNFTTDDELRKFYENNMKGGPASVMGNRYVKEIDTRKEHFGDKNKLFGTSLCQSSSLGNFIEFEVTERKKIFYKIQF